MAGQGQGGWLGSGCLGCLGGVIGGLVVLGGLVVMAWLLVAGGFAALGSLDVDLGGDERVALRAEVVSTSATPVPAVPAQEASIATTPTSFPAATSAPPLVPVLQGPLGGSLHQATFDEWSRATGDNRLATAADWIAAIDNTVEGDVLRLESIQLVNCICERAKAAPSASPVHELASVCLGTAAALLPTSAPTVAVDVTLPAYTPVPTIEQPTDVLDTSSADVRRMVDDTDQSVNLGGVEILLKGIGLIEWEAAMAGMPDMAALSEREAFADATVMGVALVEVENRTDGIVTVHPAQGTVVVGSEQVDLAKFLFHSDDVGGEMYPGVVKEGEVLFVLKRTVWDDIAGGVDVRYAVNGPSDSKLNRLADGDYDFVAHLLPMAQ